MKFIFFVFILLFANLYSRSENINLADADYCIDWESDKTELYRRQLFTKSVRLVFVENNNNLKNTLDTIKCVSPKAYNHYYHYRNNAVFYFINEFGQEIFRFEGTGSAGGDIRIVKDGRCGWPTDCSDAEYLNARTLTLPKIELNFPPTTDYLTTALEKFNKEDLLRFKNKIINAKIRLNVTCWSDLDTTYYIDFRVRITGECECDSTEYKKDTQKNKLKKTNGNGNRSIEK